MAMNITLNLRYLGRHTEAQEFLRGRLPVAERVLGRENITSLRLRWLYANCLRNNDDGSLDNLVEAAETLESVAKLWKRVMGERHPEMAKVLHALESVRKMLRLRRAAGD